MGVVRQVVLDQAPQRQLGRVGQVRNGLPLRKGVQRQPLRRGAGYGHQAIRGHGDMHELPSVQPNGQCRVVVHEREIGLAALQHGDGVRQRARQDVQLSVLQNRAQAHQPVSHHGACQGAAGGQRHGTALAPGQALQLLVRLRQVARQFRGGFQKTGTRSGQCDGTASALYQGCSSPGLKGADATPECGVGDVAQLGSTRKAALLRQRDEILQPLQLHGPAGSGCMGSPNPLSLLPIPVGCMWGWYGEASPCAALYPVVSPHCSTAGVSTVVGRVSRTPPAAQRGCAGPHGGRRRQSRPRPTHTEWPATSSR